MKTQTTISLSSVIVGVFMLFSPTFIFAAGFVPCDANCSFSDLLTLAYNIVHFLIFSLFLPIAAVLFAYAGFLFMTAGGSEENVAKAKSIFKNVLIGLVVMLIAWLIVKLILVGLGVNKDFILLNNVGQ